MLKQETIWVKLEFNFPSPSICWVFYPMQPLFQKEREIIGKQKLVKNLTNKAIALLKGKVQISPAFPKFALHRFTFTKDLHWYLFSLIKEIRRGFTLF